MKFFMIAPYYLYWHYTQGIVELFKNLSHIIVFEFHFFSVKELLKTLFSPFQRLKENYTRSIIDFESIAATFVVNMMMRVVGLVVRSLILFVAFFVLSISLLLVPVLLVFWLVLPLLLLIFLASAVWAYLMYKP